MDFSGAESSRLGMARGLRGIGAAPERPRIDPVRMKGEHPIVEFQSCAGFIIQANEILDVAPRFLDVPSPVLVPPSILARADEVIEGWEE
jgi:hypothetical protein